MDKDDMCKQHPDKTASHVVVLPMFVVEMGGVRY